MKSCLQRVGWGLLVAALVACAGEAGNRDTSPADARADGKGDVMAEELVDPEDVTPECPSKNWVMEFFGIADGMNIETGETILLQARIFDSFLGKPVAGATVNFTLSGDGDAGLLESAAVTSDLGVAAVNFATGSTLGVQYTLKATNPCTAPQSVVLSTVAPEQGSFLITYTLSAELIDTWGQLKVVAYADSTMQLCGAVDYTSPGSQGVELPAGESTIELTQIQANAAYVVFGVAYNADGVSVGGGCIDMVSVLPDMTTEADVTIEALAMNPAGGYDLTVQVAVKDLLATQWTDAGAALQTIMDESAQTIGQKVLDDILIYFPEGLPECGEVGAAEDIQASIDAGIADLDTATTDWLAANADEWLSALTNNVVFKGKLMVEEGDQSQAWSATWTVESLQFSGPVECGEADCDSWLLFAPDSFGLGDVYIDIDQETFDIVASGFAELEVLPFDLPIAPGKLALFALNNIVLKKQGLSNEVAELFDTTFMCSALLAKVSAQTIACINKPQTQLIESCDAAVASMASQFYGTMSSFKAEQHLAATGILHSQDDNNDLTVDALTGTFVGDFVLGGEVVATFSIPFDAVKK